MRESGKTCKKTGIERCVFSLLLYATAFTLIYCLVFWISPMHDDWSYLTAPNPNFSLADLLPGKSFWRPFDALFGWFMSLIPGWFPWFNRFLVVLAHVINTALLKRILEKTGIERKWSFFAAYFFLMSSSVWAVTVSPDALNQAYSVLFGLLALWIHLEKGGYYYLVFSTLALFCKESGVSWFFVVPLFELAACRTSFRACLKKEGQLMRTVKQVLFSLLVVAAYFVLRFGLLGNVQLGTNAGKYQIGIFSFSFVKNIVLLLSSAATGIDSIALLGPDRSLLLVGVTAALSVAFLAVWMLALTQMLRKKKPIFPLICVLLSVLGLAAPLSILGQAGEMHAYPSLFGMAVLFALGFDMADFSLKKALPGFIAIAIAFGVSSVHKLTTIYNYSYRTQQVEKQFASLYEKTTGKILVVVVDDCEGYSVFTQSGVRGTWHGMSLRKVIGWADIDRDYYDVGSMEDAERLIQEKGASYTQIFVVENDCVDRMR